MNQNLHQIVLNRLSGLFDTKLIQNNLRGMYVEMMVTQLLGEGWKPTGTDWAAWDIEHEDGTRLEVKQSAAKQTWESPAHSSNQRSFDIKKPKKVWVGVEVKIANERQADIYVFGWHDDVTENADQRNAEQWSFFVVPTSELPDQASISLNPLRKLVSPVNSNDLRPRVEKFRMQGARQ